MSDKPKMGQPGYVDPARLWDFLREMYHAAHGPKQEEIVPPSGCARAEREAFNLGKLLGKAEDAASIRDATERLVRGQVADRLWAVLGVKSPNDQSLDAALAQAEQVIRYGGVAGATMALIQATSRDAALEEAAKTCDSRAATYADLMRRTREDCYEEMRKEAIAAANEIRALKVQARAEPSGNPGEFNSSPEPLHDFGWALQQMRAGKKVRRPRWADGVKLGLAGGALCHSASHALDIGNAAATDWEIAE